VIVIRPSRHLFQVVEHSPSIVDRSALSRPYHTIDHHPQQVVIKRPMTYREVRYISSMKNSPAQNNTGGSGEPTAPFPTTVSSMFPALLHNSALIIPSPIENPGTSIPSLSPHGSDSDSLRCYT